MVRADHKQDCPFCVGAAAWKTRLRGKATETAGLYVIPNKFPAFMPSEGACERRSFPAEAFYLAKPAVGGHEVIILKDHAQLLPTFSQATMVDVLLMLQRRYRHYRRVACRPEYTMGIYNYGQEAGASIWHPHAQIFASAVVPNHIVKELHGADTYFETNGTCVFCDIVRHERHSQTRVLTQLRETISFTAYAARFPFEVWILPKKHASRFDQASPAVVADAAKALRTVLTMYDTTLGNPPLNIFIHSLPNTVEDADSYHWHIEVAPRLTTYGGFELGGSTIIDIVSPEKAAQFLRGEGTD